MGARLLLAVGLLLVAGCSDDTSGQRDGSGEPRQSIGSSLPDGPASSAPPTESSPSQRSTAPPPHPISLPALMTKTYDGHGLRLRQELLRTDAYTRYAVTYRSGRLRISGIMNVPHGGGPFPALVLNHGYIEPDDYVTGQGLAREQDYLARAGYVVLHTDYRDHAQSDPAPGAERHLRLGYTVDVINAVLALKRSRVAAIDGDRVGLLGRSMGGGITYNALVVRPGLVDAAVVYASVSSHTADNFDRWIRTERPDLARRIIASYGSPERRPEFWRGVSPYTYFGRVTEPILVHHGIVDDTCPIAWTRDTVRELRRLGKDVRLYTYPAEGHTFYSDWPLSMRRTVAFLDRQLD